MRIVVADFQHPAVVALLGHHMREATANSPAGSVFALDLTGLQDKMVTLWAVWDETSEDGVSGEGRLMGLGALREIDPQHGEVKSMRTAPDCLRRGVATAMLHHVTNAALLRSYRRLSLETGANDAFAPARAMYERAGFTPCAPFRDYVLTDFNRYYSKVL